MKTCFKCGEAKPLDEFYKHQQMGDGHLNKCKECTKKDAHATRLKKIDYYREYDIKRSRLPHRTQIQSSYNLIYQKENPDKYKAHTIVNNAKRCGRIIRPDKCSNCGIAGKALHAHHEDYNNPLQVVWLCVPCHHMRHSRAM
jgi:hypothetical protein